MNQFLDTLNGMKDLPIVRFFAQLFSEERLSPLFAGVKERLAGGTGGSLATQLIVWAVILALGTFAIDQVFYWTSPGKVEQARENWQSFTAGVQSIGVSVRIVADRVRAMVGKRQANARGHR